MTDRGFAPSAAAKPGNACTQGYGSEQPESPCIVSQGRGGLTMRCNHPVVAVSREVVVGRWLAGLATLALLAILASPNRGKAAGEPGQPVPIKTVSDKFPLADKLIRV